MTCSLAGFLELLAHVDDFDFGQRPLLHAIGQLDQRILVLLRIEIGLQRRSGRTEHDDRIGHLGAHYGNVAGVITRRFFLLVGGIVLFVDDDQREIGYRGEDRRARSHHHSRIATLDAMPLLGAFAIGESRVQDGNFIAEDLMQVGRDGRSQANFRDEQDGGAAGFEHSAHGRQIHGSLARTGDAVQQHAGELARSSLVSRIRLSADCCARFKSKSKREGRGLERETVKSAGSSRISTSPRRTSVARVVRGTSSDCRRG